MAYTPADSNTVTNPFAATWLSTYSASLEPQVRRELYQKYGKQFGVIDFLHMAGQTVNLTRDTLTTFSEGAIERPVKIDASGITSISNGAITFKIDTGDYDANGDTYLRPDDTMFIPGKHFGKTYDVEFVVLTVGASGANCTATALEDIDSFAVNVAAGQQIQVGPTLHARGTDLPSAKSRGFYTSAFETAISKEATDFAGGVQANQLYFVPNKVAGGKSGLFGMDLADKEFTLDSKMSVQLFNGQTNENSVTETDAWSATPERKGTKGMWMHAEDDAADHEYLSSFTVKDLDAVDDLFKASGVMCGSASVITGNKLYGQIQDAAHDYLSEYSQGTNLLMDNMTDFGFTAKTWERKGVDYKLIQLAQLSNHNTYGANAYNFWGYAGLVIPDDQVTIEDKGNSIYNSDGTLGGKITLPNVAVGYLNNNQEDRTRIVQPIAGMNGMGYAATNTWDRVQVGFMSEYMLIAEEVTKWVRLIKDGSY